MTITALLPTYTLSRDGFTSKRNEATQMGLQLAHREALIPQEAVERWKDLSYTGVKIQQLQPEHLGLSSWNIDGCSTPCQWAKLLPTRESIIVIWGVILLSPCYTLDWIQATVAETESKWDLASLQVISQLNIERIKFIVTSSDKEGPNLTGIRPEGYFSSPIIISSHARVQITLGAYKAPSIVSERVCLTGVIISRGITNKILTVEELEANPVILVNKPPLADCPPQENNKSKIGMFNKLFRYMKRKE